jgi:hypothetical protein
MDDRFSRVAGPPDHVAWLYSIAAWGLSRQAVDSALVLSIGSARAEKWVQN